MKNNKVLSLAIATLVLCGSTTLFSNIAKADEVNTKTEIVAPRMLATVVVTSPSGANLRSGAGTNYSTVATANYGEELQWSNLAVKKDSLGVDWYQVFKNGKLCWISSTVSRAG